MNKSKWNLIVRVITERMNNGETFDEIIADYPKLKPEEVQALREHFGQ